MKAKTIAKPQTVDGSRIIFGNDLCRQMERAKARDRKIAYATFFIGLCTLGYGIAMTYSAVSVFVVATTLIAGAVIVSAGALAATGF